MEKLQEKKKDTDLGKVIKKLDKILLAMAAQLLLLRKICKRLEKLG